MTSSLDYQKTGCGLLLLHSKTRSFILILRVKPRPGAGPKLIDPNELGITCFCQARALQALTVKIMATIQNESVIQGMSGIVGRQLVVHRKRNGQFRICAAQADLNQSGYSDVPDGNHQHLYKALLYSRTEPKISLNDASLSRSEHIVDAVSADVIHPPEIHKIDVSKYTGQRGEPIYITAGDDVYVATVGVMIVTDEGILVEKGSAKISEQNPFAWTYTTTAAALSRFVRIVVDVADVAPLDEHDLGDQVGPSNVPR